MIHVSSCHKLLQILAVALDPFHLLLVELCALGDANSDEHGKVRRAAEFSMKHETSGSLERFFEENETVTTDMTYGESWDFIKSGENSLKRHTNVNLLIKRLKAIAENHI